MSKNYSLLTTRLWSLLLAVGAGLALSLSAAAQTFIAPANTQLVGAYDFSLILNPTTHVLYASGDNSDRQLAQGNTGNYSGLVTIAAPASRTWAQVSASYHTALGLATDGTLWGWGNDDYGQLAQGSTANRRNIVQLPLPAGSPAGSTWKQASAGLGSTMALRSDGTLWAIGQNDFGELGRGNTTSTTGWVQVGTPAGAAAGTTWAQVSTANEITMALRSDGSLWTWGYNDDGELGLGNFNTIISSPTKVNLPAGHAAATWRQVGIGYGHTAALLSDGTLFSTGDNTGGQLGINTSSNTYSTFRQESTGATTWVQLGVGDYFSTARRADGSVWGWGSNFYGQLGLNSNTDEFDAPTRESRNFLWHDLAAGNYHTLARRDNSSVYGAGYNVDGELGPLTGNFYLQFTQFANSPLPVTLTDFEARRANAAVALTWHTASELNNAGFGVEQSLDGKVWKEVGFVAGHSTTPKASTYAFTLPYAPAAAYYRLRQTDTDGATQYSPLAYVAAAPADAAGPLLAWPNPARGTVQVPATDAATHLEMLDGLGRIVAQGSGPQLALPQVAPGLYVLRATAPGVPARTTRLVVE